MRNKLVIAAVICGLLLAAFLTGVGIFIVRARKTTTVPSPAAARPAAASPFANVAENDIPGRYKYTTSKEEYFLTLYDDHSLKNKDGTVLPVHRWELTAEGLVIHWINNDTVYDQVEAPGIYTGPRTDGSRRRLEKQTNADPTELVKPSPRPLPETVQTEALPAIATMPAGDVIASIRFGSGGETNKLTPRNTGGGDGKFSFGNKGGVECAQLMRKPARPNCYLYLRIDPELKTAPFERAMVLVEYFDAAPVDLRGAITIEYDGPASAYQRAPRRVPLTGTETWKEAWFVLDAPVFQSRQNAQGDFRLAVSSPELYIRSVKLLNNLRLAEKQVFHVEQNAAVAEQHPLPPSIWSFAFCVRPDFVFSKLRLAVFVDGCFWHCCPLHSTKPKNHAAFWRKKLATNQLTTTS